MFVLLWTLLCIALVTVSLALARSDVPLTAINSSKDGVRWHKKLWDAIAKAIGGLWFIVILFTI